AGHSPHTMPGVDDGVTDREPHEARLAAAAEAASTAATVEAPHGVSHWRRGCRNGTRAPPYDAPSALTLDERGGVDLLASAAQVPSVGPNRVRHPSDRGHSFIIAV